VIRVESLTVKEFRGIRELSLNLSGKNFAVCGPNGTGKSGIVDALEFALTGNVSRLSGEGRGEVSLKDHAPHVDSRNAPERAQVSVVVSIPSLKKTATITRTVKSPRAPRVVPDDADILAVLAQVQSSADFVLSRRELIKYVLATPGNRAEEIQALLHLADVERVRTGLQKIANAADKQSRDCGVISARASEVLVKALGVTELAKDKVLNATNAKRTVLGLAELADLTGTTSLKDGLVAAPQTSTAKLSKQQAQADLESVRKIVAEMADPESAKRVAVARASIASLAADPLVVTGIARDDFFGKGLDLLLDSACPFCDTAWDVEALRALVEQKRKHLAEVALVRAQAEELAAPVGELLDRAHTCFLELPKHGQRAIPAYDMPATKIYVEGLTAATGAITAFLPLDQALEALEKALTIPAEVSKEAEGLSTRVAALPDLTQQDSAREWLVLAQERLDVWREAKRSQKAASEHSIRARKIFETFAAKSDQVLEAMYKSVETDFGKLYAAINEDDEGTFSAKLVPSLGKLGFNVDFYGRGFFPPGAYHSEGHQDGMGLCLYLALMRYMHGAAFTFAVLDDVLMSVDAGHRREVCRLLRAKYPDTQFILTTHDLIWLKHMRSENVVPAGAAVQFRKWDVDHGPVEWDDRDVWQEISDYLDKNDVRSASGLLRHYLEHESAELCHRLRARVEFRGDAQHQLGDLLPFAVGRLGDLYRKGKAAANSWAQQDRVVSIGQASDAFKALVATSNVEQWQINAAVHYNSWDNLVKQDFVPVVEAFKALISAFKCDTCESLLWVAPERGTAEALRCECGDVNINLLDKP
jgi:energy-coupling factor transporter ATP-binding protein EcfA2